MSVRGTPPQWLENLTRIPEIFVCLRETAQWLPVTLAYLRLRPLRYPYELRLRSGEVLTLGEWTDLVVFWMVFARRHYPVRSSDRVILDIGANMGLFTAYAARKAPSAQITSVEPFPDTFRTLVNTVESNHLTKRVTVLNFAITRTSGVETMDSAHEIPSVYRRIYSADTKALNVRYRGEAGLRQTADGIPVQTRTLQDVLDIVGVASVDLLKLNIHGSEYEVLMSAPPEVLHRFRRIAVQYHDMPAESSACKTQLFEHLTRSGLRLALDDDTECGSGLAVFASWE